MSFTKSRLSKSEEDVKHIIDMFLPRLEGESDRAYERRMSLRDLDEITDLYHPSKQLLDEFILYMSFIYSHSEIQARECPMDDNWSTRMNQVLRKLVEVVYHPYKENGAVMTLLFTEFPEIMKHLILEGEIRNWVREGKTQNLSIFLKVFNKEEEGFSYREKFQVKVWYHEHNKSEYPLTGWTRCSIPSPLNKAHFRASSPFKSIPSELELMKKEGHDISPFTNIDSLVC